MAEARWCPVFLPLHHQPFCPPLIGSQKHIWWVLISGFLKKQILVPVSAVENDPCFRHLVSASQEAWSKILNVWENLLVCRLFFFCRNCATCPCNFKNKWQELNVEQTVPAISEPQKYNKITGLFALDLFKYNCIGLPRKSSVVLKMPDCKTSGV